MTEHVTNSEVQRRCEEMADGIQKIANERLLSKLHSIGPEGLPPYTLGVRAGIQMLCNELTGRYRSPGRNAS